jgi:hypothetical protein
MANLTLALYHWPLERPLARDELKVKRQIVEPLPSVMHTVSDCQCEHSLFK